MTKSHASQKRLLIALAVSAPILLGVYWLVQNGSRLVALSLFFMMFITDFLLLKPRVSAPSVGVNKRVPRRAVWVVGGFGFLGSVSVLANGVETRHNWEIIVASCGIWAIGLGLVYFARR
jgi:hypothetical protein